jgi:hypothetical protein
MRAYTSARSAGTSPRWRGSRYGTEVGGRRDGHAHLACRPAPPRRRAGARWALRTGGGARSRPTSTWPPGTGRMTVTHGMPSVRVPVLSNATIVASPSRSITTADFTSTPWRPARAIAAGVVASTTAHGEATIMNVIARSRAPRRSGAAGGSVRLSSIGPCRARLSGSDSSASRPRRNSATEWNGSAIGRLPCSNAASTCGIGNGERVLRVRDAAD